MDCIRLTFCIQFKNNEKIKFFSCANVQRHKVIFLVCFKAEKKFFLTFFVFLKRLFSALATISYFERNFFCYFQRLVKKVSTESTFVANLELRCRFSMALQQNQLKLYFYFEKYTLAQYQPDKRHQKLALTTYNTQ